MNRKLGSFERALVIANRQAPFHIVSVLRLENPPPPESVVRALKILQLRHPFLSARLVEEGGEYSFVGMVQSDPPLQIIPRENDEDWLRLTEGELGTRLDVSGGPLYRGSYLYKAGREPAELILSFFHPIIDAASLAQFSHELLAACSSSAGDQPVAVSVLQAAPPVETGFPPAFRGARLNLNILRYALRQLWDEIAYRVQTLGKRMPKVHSVSAPGRILTLQLPEDWTEDFARRARRERVTLNSALNAAILLGVNRHLYRGEPVPMRTFTFANLRPYVRPPLGAHELACYISMLRYTVFVAGSRDFWSLARAVHRKMYASFRSGEKFVASVMTESLMKMLTRFRAFRMGSTALNYSGVIPLQAHYGDIHVKGVHGYISPFDLGPEFSGEAQIFDGCLFMDFIYLESDMTRETAQAIVEEINTILRSVGILASQQEPRRAQE